MDFGQFTIFVTFCGIIYAAISKFLQEKLVDRKLLDRIQKESKQLSEQLNDAKKSNNKAKIEEIMQKQVEFLPKMNQAMMSQLKPLAITLVFLFLFQYVFDYFDPYKVDDISITLGINASNCANEHLSDGYQVGCYQIQNDNAGEWKVNAHAYVNQNELAQNSTYFYYLSNTSDDNKDAAKGNLAIFTDKPIYEKGETVKIYGKSDNPDARILVILNNGTFFKVSLPFTIPLINVKNIYAPYWWFILISLITNLIMSFVLGQIRKRQTAIQ